MAAVIDQRRQSTGASATPAPEAAANELIRWMEVPGQPNVFALGNFARQVTFASQQTRALNLIWALFKANRLAAGRRVAVVGAGLGGMMAAAAALARECDVDLFEQASQTCPIQRGNDIRFIHPNILDWPEDGSELAETDFPFLNWTAATVRGVVKQIDLQWKPYSDRKRLRQFFNYRVTRVFVSPRKAGPRQPWLAANRVVDGRAAGDGTSGGMAPGYLENSYDCVILAVGFGEERSMLSVPFLSYWENDSLHQETGRERRNILVSGCGDGGLIDALRLRLRNFDHADFVRRFLTAAKSPALIAVLKKIDNELRPHALAPDISLRLRAAYDDISIPDELNKIADYFREQRRTDTTVTLNSPAPGPLSFQASLLNRYATYLAVRHADLHYLSGRIVAERLENGRYRVTLRRDDVELTDTQSFDRIIVRHGPLSAIQQLLPASAITELRDWWTTNADITTRPFWKDSSALFVASGSVVSGSDALDLAMTTFESAYRELRKDPSVQAVAVGEYDGKSGFIVTLQPGSTPRESNRYASVPVQFVALQPQSTLAATEQAPSVGPRQDRLLPMGVGLYNYDAARRRADASSRPVAIGTSPSPASTEPVDEVNPIAIGTLGCFAKDKKNDMYLISTAFVLAPDASSKDGDRIFREGESPATGNPVAKLARFVAAQTSGESGATIDAASARLEPDIRPDYGRLGPSRRVDHVGRPEPGDRVAKVGRTSGLTAGVVQDLHTSVRIEMGAADPVMFEECIVIVGDDDRQFSMGGDAGSVVVRDDGAAVGMVIAGSAGGRGAARTIACSLESVLAGLELVLLPISGQTESPQKVKRPARAGRGKARRARASR